MGMEIRLEVLTTILSVNWRICKFANRIYMQAFLKPISTFLKPISRGAYLSGSKGLFKTNWGRGRGGEVLMGIDVWLEVLTTILSINWKICKFANHIYSGLFKTNKYLFKTNQ